MRTTLTLALALGLGSTPISSLLVNAQDRPVNRPNNHGVIERFDFSQVDDLLDLGPQVRMIMFDGASEVAISSAHLEMFKRWVAAGGVAYFFDYGWSCSLNRKLNIVEWARIRTVKENGTNLDGHTGELVVRGLFPFLQIGTHRITEGVQRLYVCNPGTEFRAVSGTHVIPLLQLGYSEGFGSVVFINPSENQALGPEKRARVPHRHLATVFALFEMGSGLIVYDGTSFVRGPNSFGNNSYDWTRMYENIMNYAGTR